MCDLHHTRFQANLLALSRRKKQSIVFLLDTALVFPSVCCAELFISGTFKNIASIVYDAKFPKEIALCVLILWVVAPMTGLYGSVFRYFDKVSVERLVRSSAAIGIISIVLFSVIGIGGIHWKIGPLYPLFLLGALFGSRWLIANLLRSNHQNILDKTETRNVFIYGAGEAGRQLNKNLQTVTGSKVVGFLDDEPSLFGARVDGIVVLNPDYLNDHIKSFRASEVLMALPSAPKQRKKQIVEFLRSTKIKVRTLPIWEDLIDGRVRLEDLRDLSVDEILGRQAITANLDWLKQDVTQKNVMITGAGGSIGSEICRKVLQQIPRSLILLDNSEFALYQILTELQTLIETNTKFETVKIYAFLGSVGNFDFVDRVIKKNQIETIYHAAAYKHVPLVEKNILSAFENNVLGTKALAKAASKNNVIKFILVSTDKAVKPTSMMGASKRFAELAVQLAAVHSPATSFAIVRFGNVFGSSGSVVPLFRKQIDDGGPVTITDVKMTRFFMTIEEAAELVIQAGALQGSTANKSGTVPVFLLDMGER